MVKVSVRPLALEWREGGGSSSGLSMKPVVVRDVELNWIVLYYCIARCFWLFVVYIAGKFLGDRISSLSTPAFPTSCIPNPWNRHNRN